MGIELKVTVHQEGAVSLFGGPNRLALLECLRDHRKYSPNLFTTPITLGKAGFRNQRVEEYLKPRMGKRYEALSQLLDSAIQTAYSLWQTAVDGAENVGAVVAKDLSERRRLARYFNELGAVDISAMNEYQRKMLEFGVKGIILAVLYANELYDPNKRIEFLKHVKQGNVDDKHKEAMLAPYLK